LRESEIENQRNRRKKMTICPVAIAVGCRKCPVFKACPLKGVIGDYQQSAGGVHDESAPGNATGSGGKKPGRKN
jgi:hypothetical protein